jgi:FKBP-type peptidyl-prolyl cis-trans isomerase FkpA
MKKLNLSNLNLLALLLISICCLNLTSCLNSTNPNAGVRDANAATIRDYVAKNNLVGTYTKYDKYDNNEIFYSRQRAGFGTMVKATDAVEVSYSLYNLEGLKLAVSNSYIFNPNTGAFILGLAEGVLLMQNGEKGRFLIPSALAFGSSAVNIGGVIIPANSVIIIDVEVIATRTETEQQAYEMQRIKNYIRSKNQVITKETEGVVYVRTAESPSPAPVPTNTTISLNYVGKLLDGTIFDQNTSGFPFYNSPSNPSASRVITGWVTGVNMMQMGETGIVYITSKEAYGARGSSPKIAPYAPLFFELSNLQ